MRVVVAEDHALLRDGLTRLLTAYGVEVALALDGTDGLAAALAREDIDAAGDAPLRVRVRLVPGVPGQV